MCIAIPGKIISVEGQHAKVDFSGNVVNVNVGLITPEVGKDVLVHAGCAIEVMEQDKAQELLTLFEELEEAEAEWNQQA